MRHLHLPQEKGVTTPTGSTTQVEPMVHVPTENASNVQRDVPTETVLTRETYNEMEENGKIIMHDNLEDAKEIALGIAYQIALKAYMCHISLMTMRTLRPQKMKWVSTTTMGRNIIHQHMT